MIAIAVGAVAILGAVAAAPQAMVTYHRVKLESDFEYFYEIAAAGTETLEGRAILAYLSTEDARRSFVQRLLDEAAPQLQSEETRSRWIAIENQETRPLKEVLSDWKLNAVHIGAGNAAEGAQLALWATTLNGEMSWSIGISESEKLQTLVRWLSHIAGDATIDLDEPTTLRVDVTKIAKNPSPRVAGAWQGFDDPRQAYDTLEVKCDSVVEIKIAPSPVVQRQRLLDQLSSPDREVATYCLREVDDPDGEVTRTVLSKIGAIGNEAVNFLTQCDPDAIWPAIDSWFRAVLASPNEHRHDMMHVGDLLVRRTLRGEQEQAMPYLFRLLNCEDALAAKAATNELAKLRDVETLTPGIVTELLANLDRPLQVRRDVVQCLSVVVGSDDLVALEPLMKIAENDEDSICRERAIAALAGLESAALPALPLLVKALDSPELRVRFQAAGAIGYIGPAARSAVPKLKNLLEDDDRLVRDYARWSIERLEGSGETAKGSVPESDSEL